jgi:hypothetical protein
LQVPADDVSPSAHSSAQALGEQAPAKQPPLHVVSTHAPPAHAETTFQLLQ